MKRDLALDIEVIWKILINCKENFLYCRYLYNPDTTEESAYLQYSRHFHFIRDSLWRLCIIELYKLVSRSEHDRYNLWAFIRNLRKGTYELHHLQDDKIAEWEHMLIKNRTVIKTVSLLRKKLYAHTDAEVDATSFNISFVEVEEIIVIAETVLVGIYQTLFNRKLLLETPIFEREGFDIVAILAAEERKRISDITNLKHLD